MFKDYKYGCWKKEIRKLLIERLRIKDRIRYHKKRIAYHEDKMNILTTKILKGVERELEKYLIRAGNKI